MKVPGRTTLFAGIVLGLLSIGVAVVPQIKWLVLVLDAVLVALFLYEARLLDVDAVVVTREFPLRLRITRESEFVYRIENRGGQATEVNLRQPWPESFGDPTGQLRVRVAAGEVVRAALKATPIARGSAVIPPAEVQVAAPNGLACARWTMAEPITVTVYPNLQHVGEFDILRRHRALGQIGVHRIRRVGAGREFDRMRDYIPDDEYRDVNWKATARHGKPMTNTYVSERSQEVMLCLDTGRMMGNPVGAGTVLDCAVDAAMMLAHACVWQGDRIGLGLFGDTVTRFIRPTGGTPAVRRVIEELVDAQTQPVFPSYAAMVAALRAGHRRRSMVFLFTDLNDPQLASDLAAVAPLLSRSHLVVVVSLRDAMLDRVAGGPSGNREETMRVLAARSLASERVGHVAKLQRAGVKVLEADADKVTMQVVNRYLEIKMRQLG